MPVTSSDDRVLDLEPAVDLDEVGLTLRAEEELERPRALVADCVAGTLDGRLHLLPGLRRQRHGRRLLDELLVTALDRALALSQRQHAPVLVAQDLDLDVPCRDHDLLEVERAVPERGVGLRGRRPERVVEPLREVDETHPLAAAARRRLEKDGKADLRGRCTDLRHRRRAVRAGDERHAGSPHLRLRGRLVAEPLHHLRRGTDEHEVVLRTRAREGGVLREEAVARVHGLAAGRLRRCYEVGMRR